LILVPSLSQFHAPIAPTDPWPAPLGHGVVPLKRALISVSDKTGLLEIATRLAQAGVELISTGGTASALQQAGLPVRDVGDVTGFPEMMDGRVKTLHPVVHGGLLYRRDLKSHREAAQTHSIEAIDLVWVNLYPFEAALAAGADADTLVENIDIGGPAMLRAGAKNAASVAVATDLSDMKRVLEALEAHAGTDLALRRWLAAKTYARTAAYDAAVSNWYLAAVNEPDPDWRAVGGPRLQKLRYGENPHQRAGLYGSGQPPFGLTSAEQVQGKELS